MDTTYDRDGAADEPTKPDLERLAAVDPADAPVVAEEIADHLAAALEKAGAVLEPVQLPLEEGES
ncbi:MAG: hypothetical protein KJP12_03725 [Acidimicrobiia bacterium]|nr:hypothetical protein [Acidimicrobiia bacterium]MBT8214309.1 hypothetical protein [Acidimicrobiia bacterium]NNF68635.1 hypothetical protein [Acidimicrobiia bacterium]NNK91163.1 hypothetical protein [Acidimicrobiia bacterium]